MTGRNAAARMGGVQVFLGATDQYSPLERAIFLHPSTHYATDDLAILRACHEAAHVLQHQDHAFWFEVRRWWPRRTLLLGAAYLMTIGCQWAVWLGISGWLIGWIAILCNERDANQRAVRWLNLRYPDRFPVGPSLTYLRGLTRSYFLATWI